MRTYMFVKDGDGLNAIGSEYYKIADVLFKFLLRPGIP
jgi:hypothetical protein